MKIRSHVNTLKLALAAAGIAALAACGQEAVAPVESQPAPAPVVQQEAPVQEAAPADAAAPAAQAAPADAAVAPVAAPADAAAPAPAASQEQPAVQK